MLKSFSHILSLDYDNRFRVYEAIISMRKGRKCLMFIYKSNKTHHTIINTLKYSLRPLNGPIIKLDWITFATATQTCSMLQ